MNNLKVISPRENTHILYHYFLFITDAFLKHIIKNAFSVLVYDFLNTNQVKQSIYICKTLSPK